MGLIRKKPLSRGVKPIPRMRAKKRTWKSQRCSVRGCNKKSEVSVTRPTEVPSDLVGTSPFLHSTLTTYWCKSHAKAEADRRFSLFIRERDRYCRIRTETPCVGPLQCCHLLSRRFHATRWDESNAVAGCAGHHSHWTRNPDRWAAWLDERQRDFLPDGMTLADLRDRAFNGDPMDVADVLARYPATEKEETA